MFQTDEKHHVVFTELLLINSRMRAGLLEFDKGTERLRRYVGMLG